VPSLIEGVGVSKELQSDQEIVVVVYYDDGDRGFNPSLDSLAYYEGTALARFVKTGAIAPESAVVPNTKGENGDVAQIVTYTDSGFIPRNSEISPGDTVRFINKSSSPMWVASNEHPAHMILPTFDQFGASAYDEIYEYTFEKEGVWEYHDHINASRIGAILVHSN
jgi:plastocyanin